MPTELHLKTQKNDIPSLWPGVALLCLSLIIGLLCYKDYGMSWDEPAQRGVGKLTYNYVTKGDITIKTYDDRGLGTGFELPLYAMEKWFGLTDTHDIYQARHLVTHLFFLLGVFCGYLLARRLFKDQFVACLEFLLLAFHPRIYAHSFFNTKDIPFLSAILIAMLACHIAFEKNRWPWYLLLGLACGYATSIRAMGIILLPVMLTFFICDIIQSSKHKADAKTAMTGALSFLAGFCGMLYICWPILWSAPFFYFKESFTNLANIVWTGKVLFNGIYYTGDQLPWNYMPVWFCITIPELWLISGLVSFCALTMLFFLKPMKYLQRRPERNYLLYLALFAGPILAMILFHGVNIDDWRHLYFIYPSFVMLALWGISQLLQYQKAVFVKVLCVLQAASTIFFMLGNHPYQQVYFNSMVSHSKEYLRTHYDLEYWGVAYKQGIDYILAHDTSAHIAIYAPTDPTPNNIKMLDARSRERVVAVADEKQADYFITNFRMHPADYAYPKIFYEVKALNSTILRVYKLKD